MNEVADQLPDKKVCETPDWHSLVYRFRNQTLPKSEWTHAAHLVVALWHLLEYADVGRALCYLRSGIILFNHSVGNPNTDARGYHETITVFWVQQISVFLESRESRDFDALVPQLLNETPFLESGYIFRFYRKDDLLTPLARGTYVAP